VNAAPPSIVSTPIPVCTSSGLGVAIVGPATRADHQQMLKVKDVRDDLLFALRLIEDNPTSVDAGIKPYVDKTKRKLQKLDRALPPRLRLAQ
jgi:hypothetical protein